MQIAWLWNCCNTVRWTGWPRGPITRLRRFRSFMQVSFVISIIQLANSTLNKDCNSTFPVYSLILACLVSFLLRIPPYRFHSWLPWGRNPPKSLWGFLPQWQGWLANGKPGLQVFKNFKAITIWSISNATSTLMNSARTLDTDNNGYLDFTEFLLAMDLVAARWSWPS